MADKKPPPDMQERAAEISRKVARRSARETRKAIRRFGSLVIDTTKTILGVGRRRINRRNNRTTAGRYINDLITLAETTHLAGRHINLSEILIEPRFLPLPDVVEPRDPNEAVQEVYDGIPRMPDLPEIAAPYNIPSYRIPELAVGNRRLAILGLPGSGRTTALMSLLLWSIRELQFEEKDDPVKQLIQAEFEELSDKEKEKQEQRRQERIEAARAEVESMIESGKIEQPKATTQEEAYRRSQEEDIEEILPEFNELLPIFIHAADLNVNASAYGKQIDPAEPLVRALQRQVSTLTARTIPRLIYARLEQNRTLVLLDGYDELPAAGQERVRAWLRAFNTQYGKNFIIMSGPAVGYGSLTQLGMTPLFVKPWNNNEKQEYLQKWVDRWEDAHEQDDDLPEVSNKQIKRASIDTVGLTPAELTLKIWALFTEDEAQSTPGQWAETYLQTQIGPDDYNNQLTLLQAAATLQTDLGFITRQGIEVLFREQDAKSGGVSQKALDQLDTDSDGVADVDLTDEDDLDTDEDDAAIERAQQLRSLVFAGVLRAYRGGRYRFRHGILADYLAGLTLSNTDDEQRYALAKKPNWARPLRFAISHADLNAVAQMKLAQHPDILLSHLIELAHWLGYLTKTEDIPWRDELLRRLGNAFVREDEFVTTRERIAAALVATRDPQGAIRVFEYGLQDTNPDVQRLSCLGIGALGEHGRKHSNTLSDIVNNPSLDIDVQIAAAHALGALRTEGGYRAMEEALQESEAQVQQAIAEALAQIPEYGYQVLYNRLSNDDIFIKRAALFGLSRIETEWANDLIHETFLEEDEWFVRVVAQEAFIERDTGPFGPRPAPTATDIEWIADWADQQHIDVPEDEDPNTIFKQLLNAPQFEMRVLGAIATGQVGVVEATRQLYSQLADEDPIVREASHKALVELQLRIGQLLPDPT